MPTCFIDGALMTINGVTLPRSRLYAQHWRHALLESLAAQQEANNNLTCS